MAWPILGVVLRAMAGGAARGGARRARRAAVERQTRISRSIAVGTNRAYARIHQMGGQAGRGRQVTIPARPFLGLNKENRQEIGRIVNDHITEGLRR